MKLIMILMLSMIAANANAVSKCSQQMQRRKWQSQLQNRAMR